MKDLMKEKNQMILQTFSLKIFQRNQKKKTKMKKKKKKDKNEEKEKKDKNEEK